jgi:hypothetical protein
MKPSPVERLRPLIELLAEWDAEVEEHGIWTSGHSIAARIVAKLRPELEALLSAPSGREPDQ